MEVSRIAKSLGAALPFLNRRPRQALHCKSFATMEFLMEKLVIDCSMMIEEMKLADPVTKGFNCLSRNIGRMEMVQAFPGGAGLIGSCCLLVGRRACFAQSCKLWWRLRGASFTIFSGWVLS